MLEYLQDAIQPIGISQWFSDQEGTHVIRQATQLSRALLSSLS
jgi:hypothetical protein